MNGKQFATIVLLVLVIAIAWWYHPVQRPDDTGTTQRDRRDSYAEQVRLQVMDAGGQPAYVLDAASMDYYPDEDRLILAQPRLDMRQPDGIHWELRAEHALTGLATEQVQLQGEVHIRRVTGGTRNPLEIATRDVRVDTSSGMAVTAAAARISGNGYRIDSVGLQADLKRRRLELDSQVRGHFDAAS